jgi:hypothetical protein
MHQVMQERFISCHNSSAIYSGIHPSVPLTIGI